MKDHTFDRSVLEFTPAVQPNFDDERTVQSARPVVPLEKINAKLRHRKQWFLGGAFAVALMLGAATALLASYLKLRNVSNPASEISAGGGRPGAGCRSGTSGQRITCETLENSEEPIVPDVPRKEPAVKRKAVSKTECRSCLTSCRSAVE